MQSYFSHDSNARDSEKLLNVRIRYGAAGYGVFFMLLERLREDAEYKSVKDYNAIAFNLRVDTSLVKSVVEDFGLFVFTEDGKYFYSESFNRRMKHKDEVRQKRIEAGRQGGLARAANANRANANLNSSKSQANAKKNASNKSKEKKDIIIINNNNIPKKEELFLGSIDIRYKETLEEWLKYKREIGNSYKSEQSLKVMYNQLLKLSANNPETAKQIVTQSIANNWKGLFALNDYDKSRIGNTAPNSDKSTIGETEHNITDI